jgi:hypothetical protein
MLLDVFVNELRPAVTRQKRQFHLRDCRAVSADVCTKHDGMSS